MLSIDNVEVQRLSSTDSMMDEKRFIEACNSLVTRAQVAGHAKPNNLKFRMSEDTHSSYLRITKTFYTQPIERGVTEPEAPDIDSIEEIEDNVIYPQFVPKHVSVEYDVLFSPSYQVPVLYFQVHTESDSSEDKWKWIYQHLVPNDRKGELQSVGVLGGISQANHPALGWPCFFVHPCRTAEAMELLIGDENVSPQQYLQIWIGLIGSAVGLNLPIELAIEQ